MTEQNITAYSLISEVKSAFAGSFDIPYSLLTDNYNSLCEKLTAALPCSEETVTAVSHDGVIDLPVGYCCTGRVFCGSSEFMLADEVLLQILPDAPLYCPKSGKLRVSRDGTFIIRCRKTGVRLTDDNFETEKLFLPDRHAPLIRAYLYRAAYLYAGDFDSAEVALCEYERLLKECKGEYGVA